MPTDKGPKCESEEDLGQTCVHKSANPFSSNHYQHFNCCPHSGGFFLGYVKCSTCGECAGEGSILDGRNGIEQTCCTSGPSPSKKVDSSGAITDVDCTGGLAEHCCKVGRGGGRKDFVCFDHEPDIIGFCAGLVVDAKPPKGKGRGKNPFLEDQENEEPLPKENGDRNLRG